LVSFPPAIALKEYFFFFPAILLFMVLVLFGLAQLTCCTAQSFHIIRSPAAPRPSECLGRENLA
jgi:hypothetical protein